MGGELIRMGLERGTTAREAAEVMTAHIANYGQGRFTNDAGVKQGDNAYMVVDPRETYLIEAAGHDWAMKEVSPTAPRIRTPCGVKAAPTPPCRAAGARSMSPRSVAILSDHWLDDDVNSDLNPFPGDRRSVCMHPVPDNVQSTTSSVVADLCDDASRLPVYWYCLYSPCIGVFFPVFLEGVLPAQLSISRAERTANSPWWMFHDLAASGLAGGRARLAVAEKRTAS